MIHMLLYYYNLCNICIILMLSVQQTISSHLDELSPKLRAAASFVLEQPEEVATRSMRHVARMSNLQPPTFSRLARAVGCKDFEDLRERCRADLKRNTLSFAEKAQALQAPHSRNCSAEPGTFIVRQAEAAVDNIQHLVNSLDNAVLAQIADRLVSANRVYLIGSMSSRAFVEYMSYMADMAFTNWQVIDQRGTGIATDLSAINKSDVVLALSNYPYARGTIEGTRIAQIKGAFVISITDSLQAPILQYSDQGLQVSTESPHFFTSHVATLVLLESLIAMVLRRAGKKAQKRIKSVEKINQSLGEFWPTNNPGKNGSALSLLARDQTNA
jgi:DNA-binding MurR/RpiR family transcriptional regulator